MGAGCFKNNPNSHHSSSPPKEDNKAQAMNNRKKDTFQIILTPEPQLLNILYEDYYYKHVYCQSTTKQQLQQSNNKVQKLSLKTLIENILEEGQMSLEDRKDRENNVVSSRVAIVFDEEEHSQAEFISEKTKSSIKWNDLFIYRCLGSSSRGQVYLAQEKKTLKQADLKPFIVKKLNYSDVNWPMIKENFKLSRKMHYQPENQHYITGLSHSFWDQQYYYLMMQWAQGGNVSNLIKFNSKSQQILHEAGQPGIRFIVACTIIGLQYVHSHNLAYLNIKPQNLLVFPDGYVKLSDLDLLLKNRTTVQDKKKFININYNAPQINFGLEGDKLSDLWALGVLTYQLSNLILPFDFNSFSSNQQYYESILSAEKKRYFVNKRISFELKQFINSLLKLEPGDRLGVNGWQEVKCHDFFRIVQFPWRQLENKQLKSPLKEGLKVYIKNKLTNMKTIKQNFEQQEQQKQKALNIEKIKSEKKLIVQRNQNNDHHKRSIRKRVTFNV